MSRSEHRSGPPPAFLCGCVAVVLAVVAGCAKRSVDLSTADQVNDGTTQTARTNCSEVLGSAVSMLQPDRLGLTTDARQASDLLNQWMQDCGEKEPPGEVGPVAKKLLGAALGKDVDRLNEGRYVGRDMEHVRTCLLMKKIGDLVVKPADRDVDRVNLLFEYVVRNVALAGPSSEPLPLTPYEVLLFGRGAPADRAWVFAELLRQLRIDAVILRPAEDAGAKPPAGTASTDAAAAGGAAPEGAQKEAAAEDNRWLVGVLLDDSPKPVYLFDPWLGISIPAPGDVKISNRPATLAEVLAEPALLQRLAVDEATPYRFTAEALKKLRVELIVDSDCCRPRMKTLQGVLTGENAAVLYDPLDDAEDAPGGLARVRAFGGDAWGEDAISLWGHAERNLAGFEKLDARQQQRMVVRKHPFEAPVPIKIDAEKRELNVGNPRREQLRSRMAQLQGDRQNAVKTYQMVRLEGRLDGFPPQVRAAIPPAFLRMHARAEEDAFFWTGMCQHEGGDYAASAQTFSDYLRRFPEGEWVDHARGLLALSFARQEKFAAAQLALSTISPADPARAAHQLLLKRCRDLREK